MSYDEGVNNICIVGKLMPEENVSRVDSTGRHSSVWINKNNKIQFLVEPISEVPYSYPEIKYFNAYADYLVNFGFDEFAYDYTDREKAFKEFLNKYVIIFKPYRNKTNYDNVDEVSFALMRKPDGYNEHSGRYRAIPVFQKSEEICSQKKFEQLLSQQKFLGMTANVSKDKEDIREFILWYDEEQEDQYTAYGIIDDMDYDKVSGLCFTSNEIIKSMSFNEDWQKKSILVPNSSVVFVNIDTYNEICETVKINGQAIDDSEEVNKEHAFLDRFIKYTASESFVYEERDLVNFHVAMKSSTLVILAGMSGTGKSKLVTLYGKSLGLNSEQIKIIPVRPSWTDDADILGYLDTMNMVYRPSDTGLVDTLIEAQNKKDLLYIICFDEMNLSRVEHYFSQFLSVLEIHNEKRYLQLYNSKVENRVYNNQQYGSRVELGDNILFVGTVNLDESTYHFSDKTLDRANVINLHVCSMQKLKELSNKKRIEEKSLNPQKTELISLSFKDYSLFQVDDEYFELADREIEFLNELHEMLRNANQGMGIGFRIARQIDTYLKNIPNTEWLDRKDGFDLQVLQRIMTKIRGAEETLEDLFGTFNEKTEGLVGSKLIEFLDKYDDVSDFKETRNLISNKAKELKIHGYTI